MVKKISKFWGWFKPALISYLRDTAVKSVLKKLLGSAVIGGPKAWIIKYVATELYDEVAEPLLKALFTELGYIYDKREVDCEINMDAA